MRMATSEEVIKWISDICSEGILSKLPKNRNGYDIKVFDKENNEIGKVNGSWTFVGVNKYRIQIQYKNGITSYVQSKGLTVSYNSVMSNDVFDLNKAIGQLQKGNPISLYMSSYGFTNVTDNGSLVSLDKNLYDDNHIVIAYGYEKVSYFDVNGRLIRTEIYLKVSTGINGVSGVYVVNNYGKLNDAEAVAIK